jgi:hypothetical protein
VKVCTVEGCASPHLALGYCSRHYSRFKRWGDPLGAGQVRPYQVRSRVLDALQLDGGWLTLEGVRLLLPDVARMTIENHLRTGVRSGKLLRRSVDLASRGGGKRKGQLETRIEWRAL